MNTVYSRPKNVETWRSFRGVVFASDLGRIKGPSGVLGGWVSERGYAYVQIALSKHRVHRVVAEAFWGPIPDGYVVDHLDGNKRNNALLNLEIVSHKENMRRASLSGRCAGGRPRGALNLRPEERLLIEEMLSDGESQIQIAKRVGRGRSTIQRVWLSMARNP